MLIPVEPKRVVEVDLSDPEDITATVDGEVVHVSGFVASYIRSRFAPADSPRPAAQERTHATLALFDALIAANTDAAIERGIQSAGSADKLASRMLALVPDEKPEIDTLVGPFFDTAKLATWRDVRKQAIQKAAAKHDILGMKMADNVMVFPAFQFGPHGENLPHLREVLALLDPDWVDPWGSALWLNMTDPEFGGTTAAEALRDGRADRVLEAARSARSAWAS